MPAVSSRIASARLRNNPLVDTLKEFADAIGKFMTLHGGSFGPQSLRDVVEEPQMFGVREARVHS